MQWHVQMREIADASISTSIGLLDGIQRLLRMEENAPGRPSETVVAGMLDLVKEHLNDALSVAAQET